MDPFYAQQQHQLFEEQQRQQQQQFQQQLHNENEYANYYGGSQHAMSPAFSNQQSPNAAYLPYDTQSLDDTVSQSAPSQGGYINEYGEEIMFEEPDPWRELAEWYWNLYNDHAGLLDPSAAIERGREDSFDSNESVTTANTEARERGPRLPPKLFRDQLINLYFVHVHPLCPIFDEYELCQAYEDSEDGMSILQKVTLLEFQAMLFAGALHLNSTQLSGTEYTGTHECHKALFKAAKNTYHACQHESRIASARSCILLSLWAPYNSDHSNSYWVDQALANAQAANLSDLSQPSPLPIGRRKLIWMSCLRRDRYLAFASRRSQRLTAGLNTNMTITRDDYGLEAVQPKFMSLLAKWQAIENFQQQCELSQVMLRLLKFQKQRRFEKTNKEWAVGVDMAELLEATSIHAQMQAWRRGVDLPFLEGKHVGIGNCDAPMRLTSIQYDSAIAFLYLPYIYVREGVETAITKEFSEVALQEVKQACSNIAKTTEVFVDAANSNDIPLSLGAWILLPIITKLVFLWNAPPSPPNQPAPNPASDLHEMRTLMTMLYIIKNRYSGGEFISAVLDSVMNHLQNNQKRRGMEALSLLQDAAEQIDKALAQRVVLEIPRMARDS